MPLYLVPTHTTSVTASATASAPIYFDYWWAFGDPDLISSSAALTPAGPSARTRCVGFLGDHAVPGGPDGSRTASRRSTQTALSATTEAFDPAVTSPTGDCGCRRSTPRPLHPVVVPRADRDDPGDDHAERRPGRSSTARCMSTISPRRGRDQERDRTQCQPGQRPGGDPLRVHDPVGPDRPQRPAPAADPSAAGAVARELPRSQNRRCCPHRLLITGPSNSG